MKIFYSHNFRSNTNRIISVRLNTDSSTPARKPFIGNFILSYNIILISSICLKTFGRIIFESSTSVEVNSFFTNIGRYFFSNHSGIFLKNSRLLEFSVYIYEINIDRKNRHHNKPQYCNSNYEFDESKAFFSHLIKLKN